MAFRIVAVEIDLYDGSAVQTLRMWNGAAGARALTAVIDGEHVQFEPRLTKPIEQGSRIEADQQGEAVRGQANGGEIEFAIDAAIWPWLAYHWKGRDFRVYEGEHTDSFAELALVYAGRVVDLAFNADTSKAAVKTADAGDDIDGPLISDLYPDAALSSLRGNPKPRLWGTVYSIAPALVDEPTGTYDVSTAAGAAQIDAIMDLRVGGVPWEEVIGTPGSGQWSLDTAAGTVTLGSKTLGADVRCDARAVGWETLTSAALLEEVVTEAGGTVDAAMLAAFAAAVPGPIGFYTTTTPINGLDALDLITAGAGGWYQFGDDQKFRVGVIAAPGTPVAALTDVNIVALRLVGIIPPAWRIRVEYRRNFDPPSNLLEGVTDAEAAALQATGVTAPAYENEAIKVAEPRAVDVPLISTLFVNEADAVAVRDRLAVAFGVERRLYEVTCRLDTVLKLYDTVSVDYQMVSGNYRVHSVLRSIGEGSVRLILWGVTNA